MATNVTRSQQSVGAAAAQPAPAKESSARPSSAEPPQSERRASGYGLPCSKCRLYYPADLDACPTCKTTERMPPLPAKIPAKPQPSVPEPVPDNAMLEQEREEFLRQFKSQLLEAHTQVANATESVCKFGERHTSAPTVAEICTGCYERVQERLDICEAALQIDLKEAAQIVYDAVWADPSDPNKTYQNAAGALLTELRKRAGINAVLGPFQPLEH